MGKKSKKTRWRTLPIDVGTSSNGAQNHHHHKHDTNQDENSRLRLSPVPTTETKILFNEDEYTKITTPRQDVLFKKGYFARRRYQLAAANSIADSCAYEIHNGEYLEDDEYTTEDYDVQGYYSAPQAYVDPSGGVFYISGNSSYEVYDPYTGNMTVVMGAQGHGHHQMLAAVPCQPVPVEWYNPSVAPHAPYIYPNSFPNSKRFNIDSSQQFSVHSPESMCPPTSPQDMCEDPNLYPQSYIYPGYMLSSSTYNANGVGIPASSLPQTSPCDISGFKKRKRRKKRKREGVTEEEYESSSEDGLSQSGASEQLDSKTTSDSGVHTHNSGESTPVTPPLSISLHPNIICHPVPPFTSTDEDSPDVSVTYNATSPISCYNTSFGPGHSNIPIHYANLASSASPYNRQVNFNGDVISNHYHPVIQDQFVKSRKLKNRRMKSDFNLPYSSISCSLHSRDLSVPNNNNMPQPQQKPNETPTKQLTILKPDSPRKYPSPPTNTIKILKPNSSSNSQEAEPHCHQNKDITSSLEERPKPACASIDTISLKENSNSAKNTDNLNQKKEQKNDIILNGNCKKQDKNVATNERAIVNNNIGNKKSQKNSPERELFIKAKEKSKSPEKIIRNQNTQSNNNKTVSVNDSKINDIKDESVNKFDKLEKDINQIQNRSLDKPLFKNKETIESIVENNMNETAVTQSIKPKQICNGSNTSLQININDNNNNQKITENSLIKSKKQNQKSKKNKQQSNQYNNYQCNGLQKEKVKTEANNKGIALEPSNEINERLPRDHSKMDLNLVDLNANIEITDKNVDSKEPLIQIREINKTNQKVLSNENESRLSTFSSNDCVENKFETSSDQGEELEEGYIKNNPLLAKLVNISEINRNEQRIKNENLTYNTDIEENDKNVKNINESIETQRDTIKIGKDDTLHVNNKAKDDYGTGKQNKHCKVLNGEIKSNYEKTVKNNKNEKNGMHQTKVERKNNKNKMLTVSNEGPTDEKIDNNIIKSNEQISDLRQEIKTLQENGVVNENMFTNKKIQNNVEKIEIAQKNDVQSNINVQVIKENSIQKRRTEKRRKSDEDKTKSELKKIDQPNTNNKTEIIFDRTEIKEVVKEENCTEKKPQMLNEKKSDKTQQNKSSNKNNIKKSVNIDSKSELKKSERKSASPEKRKHLRKSTSPEQIQKLDQRRSTSPDKITKRKNSRKKSSPPPQPPPENKNEIAMKTAKLFIDDMLGEAVKQVNFKLKGNRAKKEMNVEKDIITKKDSKRNTVHESMNVSQKNNSKNDRLDRKGSEETIEIKTKTVNPKSLAEQTKEPVIQITQVVNKWLVEEHGGKLPLDFLNDDDEEEIFVQPLLQTGSKNLKSNPSPVVFLNEFMGDRVAEITTSDLSERCNAAKCVKKYYNLGIRASPETEPLCSTQTETSTTSQKAHFKYPAGPIPCGICCMIQ